MKLILPILLATVFSIPAFNNDRTDRNSSKQINQVNDFSSLNICPDENNCVCNASCTGSNPGDQPALNENNDVNKPEKSSEFHLKSKPKLNQNNNLNESFKQITDSHEDNVPDSSINPNTRLGHSVDNGSSFDTGVVPGFDFSFGDSSPPRKKHNTGSHRGRRFATGSNFGNRFGLGHGFNFGFGSGAGSGFGFSFGP